MRSDMTGPKRTCAVPSTSLEADEVPLVFKKPGWQLQVCLVSVLVTPLLYRLYLVLLTIGYALCSTRPCCNSNPPNPECPLVDLKWTGVFPCQLGWIGSTLAVVILSAAFVTCYLLVTTSLKRWDLRKNIVICISLGVKNELFPSPKLSKLQSRVNSTNKLMLMPTLNLCLLLLIFHLLLQSGDIESNPGPINTRIKLSDLHTVLEKLMPAESKWFFLGLALGVHNEKLKSLQIKYQNDSQTCLREVLAIRLESVCSPLTWADLCACLRCSTVDRSALADEIEKEFKDTDPSLSRKRSIEIVGSTLDTETPSKAISQFSDTQLKLSDLHTVFESLKFEGNPPPAKKQKPNKVMEEIGSSVSMDTQSSTKVFSAVEIYKTYLTKLYDIHHLPTDAKYSLQCEQRFINLKLIDKRKNVTRGEIEMCVHGNIDQVKKNSFSLSQIACKAGEAFPKLVLITGAPGVGKTTLSWELCRRWSTGEIWTHYNLVILLHLRDEGVRAATGLIDLLECGDVATSKSVKENILPTQGEGVLFLLEGFDELPKSLREGNSIFTRLISGKLLPGSTVIVTTRPWASPQQYKDRIDQNIEILGFKPEQIKEYVDQKIIEGVPDSIHTYLSANPHISTAMYNPLHARIVVEVYKEYHEQNKSEFPNTTTELYTAYSKVLMYRYLSDHPAEEEWNGELSELPRSLRPHFACLCEVAYKGLMKENNQQLVFFKEDTSDSSNTLGFMNSVHPLHRSVTRRLSPSYNFLHLTLQEFLTAFYIWTNHSPQQQLILFETAYESLPMILQFLAGLTRFDDPWTKCVFPVPSYSEDVKFQDEKVVTLIIRHIEWLYEAQNTELFTLFGNARLCLLGQDFSYRNTVSLALGYCMAAGSFSIDSNATAFDSHKMLQYSEIVPPHVESSAFSTGLKKALRCSSRFQYLQFSCLGTHDKSWSVLMNSVPFADTINTCTIHKICDQHADLLRHNVKEVEFCEQEPLTEILTKLEANKSLQKLTCTLSSDLAAASLSDFVARSCVESLVLKVFVACSCYNISNLRRSAITETIPYMYIGLNIAAFKSQKRDKLFPPEINDTRVIARRHVIHMHKDCSEPHSPDQSAVGQILTLIQHCSGFLESFRHDKTPLLLDNDSLMAVFKALLVTSTTLKELNFDLSLMTNPSRDRQNLTPVEVNVHRDIPTLTIGLRTHVSLQKLTIHDCYGLDYCILSALKENTSIRSLKIGLHLITEPVIKEFCSLLCENTILNDLSLMVIQHNGTAFIPLLEQLQCNTHLVRFEVKFATRSSCFSIDKSSSVAICQLIMMNKTLECLKLHLLSADNNDACFLQTIAQALQVNSTLSALLLRFIPDTAGYRNMSTISEREAEAFGKMLTLNKSLQIVYLFVHCSDCTPIVRGLSFNDTIKEFHVPESMQKSAVKCTEYVDVRRKIVYVDITTTKWHCL